MVRQVRLCPTLDHVGAYHERAIPNLNPEQIEAAIADLQTLRAEVEQLRALYESSDERLEQLEVMDFQNQINALDSKCKALGSDLLEARYCLCVTQLDSYGMMLMVVLQITPNPDRQRKVGYFSGASKEGRRRIMESTNPEAMVLEVETDCANMPEVIRPIN